MPLTSATLPRHELIGLPVRVAAASNPDLVGVAGEVVMETTRTLSIAATVSGVERVWQVPKADATFEFSTPDGQSEARSASTQSNGESRETVTVEGERLVARPARRTERTGDSKWR
ncbi:ribonuclease P protein component 1 [Halorientalis brevis]|uniref:Ribonuclease P protein component 1 n=1 Tax=Halorientalis brevis TaxID=1126241 RepID=A0ABD6C6Z3_9EURY|nr:ribonuclease P protein component 1 [Halorientalis brevis]